MHDAVADAVVAVSVEPHPPLAKLRGERRKQRWQLRPGQRGDVVPRDAVRDRPAHARMHFAVVYELFRLEPGCQQGSAAHLPERGSVVSRSAAWIGR